MNHHLFHFTLGPVQTFIAQARKTQDLYAGSQLLSDLCKTGIEAIEQYQEVEVIFPSRNPKKEHKFFPNRFLAKVPEQLATFQEIGECVESRVRTAFESIAGNLLQQQGLRKPTGFDDQIENHLDIHWAFYPIQSSYAEAYREIEKLVGAIKNLRTFKQLNGGKGEVGRKCSLDGERNALFYRRGQSPAFLQPDAIPLSKLNPNEALSAVSFVKRYYPTKEKFASTTTVALMDYLAQLEKQAKSFPKVKLALDKLKKLFGEKSLIDLETGIFYEDNLTAKYFDEHDLKEYKKDIPQIRECVTTLDKFAKKSKYYAVLEFDGDNMGKWLAGEFLQDKTQLQKFHLALSQRLGYFAKIAAQKLVYPCGQTVYAGGDDFLGLVNLNYLFEALQSLRQTFDCLVNQSVKRFGCTEELTFSAGILIAHYKEPLHIVLQEARRLEKVAKDEGGRNAFAIGVMKRSGESHQICYKWQEDKEWNVEGIRFIIEQLQENFSDTFIRSLNLELLALVEEDDRDDHRDIKDDKRLSPEMNRLITRSVRKEEGKSQVVEPLSDNLLALWNSGKQSSHDKLKNFLDTLNIANFLATRVYR